MCCGRQPIAYWKQRDFRESQRAAPTVCPHRIEAFVVTSFSKILGYHRSRPNSSILCELVRVTKTGCYQWQIMNLIATTPLDGTEFIGLVVQDKADGMRNRGRLLVRFIIQLKSLIEPANRTAGGNEACRKSISLWTQWFPKFLNQQ